MIENVRYLAESQNRITLLEAIREQSYSPAELARTCSLSRTTVHRTLDGFRSRGWVEKEGRNYKLTPLGEQILNRYKTFVEDIELHQHARRLYNDATEISSRIPLERLSENNITVSTDAQPHKAIKRYTSDIETLVPPVRTLLPHSGGILFEAHDISGIQEEGLKLILPTDVEYELDKVTKQLGGFSSLSVFETKNVPSVAITLGRKKVIVGACNNHGNLRACFATTDDVVYEKVEEYYQEKLQESEAVTGEDC